MMQGRDHMPIGIWFGVVLLLVVGATLSSRGLVSESLTQDARERPLRALLEQRRLHQGGHTGERHECGDQRNHGG